MGADQRPQRHKQRHRGEAASLPGILAGQVEIAVQHEVGEVATPAMVQIHQQESEIVQHVDAGDILGKLDAVEQQRPSVHEADIAQVQIAMAETHLAGVAPACRAVRRYATPRVAGRFRCGRSASARTRRPATGAGSRYWSRPARPSRRPRRGRDASRPCRGIRRYARSAHKAAAATALRAGPYRRAGPAARTAASRRRNRRPRHPAARPAPTADARLRRG